MNNKTLHIALVETNPFHSECLYSQILFLQQSGRCSLTLIVNSRLKSIVEGFDVHPETLCIDFGSRGAVGQLWRLVGRGRFDVVIFNTTAGSYVWKLFLRPLSGRTRFVGLVHDLHKLTDSFGHRLMQRRMKDYYVLAQYVADHFPADRGLRVTHFAPAFFPEYPAEPLSHEGLWVCIPGAVEYHRRDYQSLLRLAADPALRADVRFVLLGNGKAGQGPDFLAQIKQQGLEHRFVSFSERVPNPLFYSYIQASDYLLPLIHPQADPRALEYTSGKISGMFPLALAFRKPMLCHQMFASVEHFDFNALFYNDQSALVQLLNQHCLPARYEEVSFTAEQERYLSLL